MTADNGETKAAEEKAHKLKDLARDYEKQAQAILFAAPIAMLTYTIDKVGTVGLTSCWEWLTWFSWAILALTSVLSGIRLLWIPCTWRARAEEARTGGLPENSTVKANAKAVASGREWWNRQMERGQVAGIALSFLFLFLAHAARSHFDKACEFQKFLPESSRNSCRLPEAAVGPVFRKWVGRLSGGPLGTLSPFPLGFTALVPIRRG